MRTEKERDSLMYAGREVMSINSWESGMVGSRLWVVVLVLSG